MDLSSLTKPQAKPPMLTFVSTPGAGKSTLAALFPSAVFVMAEDGTASFDDWEESAKPTVFPQIPKFNAKQSLGPKDAVLEQLRALATQPHNFKTAVIDTVTTLNILLEDEVAGRDGAAGIGEACGGFQNGFNVVRDAHQEIKSACDYLRNHKDMAIIFLAHTGVKKMKNRPDADEYSVFALDMHDKSAAVYTNLVDAVVYIAQQEFVKGHATDKKGNTTKFGKLVQTGERILIASGDGKIGYANAKNRYNFEPEIALPKGENPLLNLIPYYINGG